MKIGITQGDVNGISYEVIMKALQDMEILEDFTPIIYGSPKAAAYHRKALTVAQFSLNNINNAAEAHPKRINIVTCGDDNIKVEIGKPAATAGQAACEALEAATRDLANGEIEAMVTGPVNHNDMHSETYQFSGQTEYLEQACQTPALNMLVSGKLRVGIVANNVPLSKVASYVSEDKILSKLRILNKTLKQDFSIDGPRIAVLGLNPSAGDQGLLGNEEAKVIAPAIEKAQQEGIIAVGPYSADSIFGSNQMEKFDAILAMYYDQGCVAFRSITSNEGARFTAGLPVIRTAPVHGTEYDIAGQDKADGASMRSAIYLAMDIARNRKMNQELEAGRMTTVAEGRRERNA